VQAPRPQGQALGVLDAQIPKDGVPAYHQLSLANLPILKGLATGHNEYKFSSVTVTITVITRMGNDGEIVARVTPKNWATTTVAEMKLGGASYRYVSSQTWGVQMLGAGEWTNVANSAGFIQLGGVGLEKATHVSLLVRGNVQFR
jgi:hypothetical protein